MEVRAIARGIRVSPRKARLVCDAVRGKDIRTAMAILQFLPQKTAPVIARTLKSAAANAENNYDLDPNALYVKFIFADDGPQMKRGEFRARGRFNRIIKRSCHITVVVEEREQTQQRRPAAARRATPARAAAPAAIPATAASSAPASEATASDATASDAAAEEKEAENGTES
ncbi:MAG: 50S ribosomal protein L22 [Chloroflexia bacterium]